MNRTLPNFFSLFFSEDFSNTNCVIAAVSGGSDSLAMLFLLREYLMYYGIKKKLVVVTVDHKLRKESSEEAEKVAALCRYHTIVHETCIWESEKPKTGVIHKARLARYALLCKAAIKHGAGIIVTGHTLDDQIETYMMRAARGSERGLAVMPRVALLQQNFYLLRPLLGIRRKALQLYLEQHNILWINDPSNNDLSHERVRIRVRKSFDEQTAQKIQRIISCKTEKRKREAEAVVHMAKKIRMSLRGAHLWFDLEAGEVIPLIRRTRKEFITINSLTSLIIIATAIMGGVQYFTNNKNKILSFLEEPVKNTRRMSISGSILELTEKFLRIWREKRNLATVIIPPGYNVVWDGRLHLCNRSSEILVVRPPSKIELREIITRLPKSHTMIYDLHIPSLETSCLVCYGKKYEMPIFSQEILEQRSVFSKKVLSPFNWLVSSYDFPIFRYFQKIFIADYRKMVKSAEIHENLLPPILETTRSKPILQKNTPPVSTSFARMELI